MSDIKHARMMLDIANSDRKAIRNMLDADKFDDTIFGFHAQQAVEKLFKAWFSLRGVAYPRTHDLKVLHQLLEDQQEGGLELWLRSGGASVILALDSRLAHIAEISASAFSTEPGDGEMANSSRSPARCNI
jgi:HEPN domain